MTLPPHSVAVHSIRPVMTLDPHRLADAIRLCDMQEFAKALDEHTGVLHGLFQTMEQFRSEFMQLLKNPPEEWKMAMAERLSQRTRCESCDGSADNLAEAVDDGWHNLRAHDGDAWEYLGLCPACHDDANAREQPGTTDTQDASARQSLQELLNCAELNQDDIEEKTRALIGRIHGLLTASDSIACFACNALSPTLTAAVEQGWRDLQADPHGKGRYRGVCPDCYEKEVAREFEEAERRGRGRVTENRRLFD